MGFIGMAIGIIQEGYGIITGDDELVKKGCKRTLISCGTTLVGDWIGISDTIDAFSGLSELTEV